MYQIYIRSFADGNGDGIGDIPGIRSGLPDLRDLGVDGLRITPWHPSPMRDGGYNVADYTDIEPVFGTLADARALVDEAHALGLKIIVDFNLDFLKSPLDPARLREIIEETLTLFASVGAPATWTLSNHDETRHHGSRRARAVLLFLLGLPGSVYLYQGEELGQWKVEDTAEAEEGQLSSMLHYYRAALAARRSVGPDASAGLTWLEAPEGVLAFHRGSFGCLINFSDQPVPANGPVLISSSPVVDGLLAPDAAVWTSGLPGGDNAAQHTVDKIR
jgi:glycosidase